MPACFDQSAFQGLASGLVSDFVSELASGFVSDLEGRRLRVKVAGLPGTMSKAPSQESALALPFFAGGFSAGCF